MHRSGFVRQLVNAFKLFANVVRVEHRVFSGLAQAIWTIGEDVSQRAHEHAEVAIEGAHPSDGMRAVVLKSKLAVWTRSQHRSGEEWLQDFLAGHWTRSGTSAAMWRRKCLMEIQGHHIHAEVAGTRLTAQRVHVGAIHIKERAFVVQHIGDAVNLFFEDS